VRLGGGQRKQVRPGFSMVRNSVLVILTAMVFAFPSYFLIFLQRGSYSRQGIERLRG
jgi:hypothetical protein